MPRRACSVFGSLVLAKAEEQKKNETQEVEKTYKDMLKWTTREQPAKKTDPWGNLR
jgi:hypothetical protein